MPESQAIALQPSAEDLKRSRSDISRLIPKCLDALREVLQRFPQHYKALYRMAHYYCHSPVNRVWNMKTQLKCLILYGIFMCKIFLNINLLTRFLWFKKKMKNKEMSYVLLSVRISIVTVKKEISNQLFSYLKFLFKIYSSYITIA